VKSTMDTKIVTAADLEPGDLVLRVGLTGAAWFEVADVETYAVREFPGVVVRVEFAVRPRVATSRPPRSRAASRRTRGDRAD
jgi:hypothetical protein